MATSDDNITVIRWLDTKAVHTISSYAGAEPEDKAHRYDRKEKKELKLVDHLLSKSIINSWEV